MAITRLKLRSQFSITDNAVFATSEDNSRPTTATDKPDPQSMSHFLKSLEHAHTKRMI